MVDRGDLRLSRLALGLIVGSSNRWRASSTTGRPRWREVHHPCRRSAIKVAIAKSAAPARTSSTKWLPVESTASAVATGYSHTRSAHHRRGSTRLNASADQQAHPMCSEGMAASSLAAVASVPLCQDPNAWVRATTSRYTDGSYRRGGAVGTNQ